MADYTINVNFNDDTADGYKSQFSVEKGEEAGNDFSFGEFVKGAKAFAQAIPGASLVKQSFDWGISLIGRETGSQDAQEKANAVMKIIGQVGGTVMAFAAGGPVGGILAMASTALSYGREAEQKNYERSIENINLRLLRERGGPSLNRSRKEE